MIDSDEIQSPYTFLILIWHTEKKILQEKPSDVTCKPNFPEWERLDVCWTLHTPFSCIYCNKSELSLGIEGWAFQDQVSVLFVTSVCQFIASVSLGVKGNVLIAVQGSLGLKKNGGGGSLRACYDMITPKGLILVLKLIFYSLHFPSPVVLKPRLHLGITQGALSTCVALGAHHQINRIPWGLSTGRLKHSSNLKSELSWPFSLFLTVLSLFKVYLSPKWGLYFSKID